VTLNGAEIKWRKSYFVGAALCLASSHHSTWA
jgi:hypothetical protein